MASFHAIFARIPGHQDHAPFAGEIARALRELDTAPSGEVRLRHRVGDRWVRIEPPPFADTPPFARDLSVRLETEVIDLQIQTTASAINYWHLDRGNLVRQLGCADGGWGPFEGASEPWEDGTIFSDAARAADMEDVADDDDHRNLIELAYSSRTIDEKHGLPYPSETRIGDGIASHFGLWIWATGPGEPPQDLDLRENVGWPRRFTASALVVIGALPMALFLRGPGSLYCAGFLTAWTGFSLRWRRTSVVIRFGGGFLAATVLALVALLVGSLLR